MEVAPFGVDPLMLLIGANNAIARQYESSHLPVQLVSARSEQWIAGCEICQANLVSLARAAGFTPEITHSTDDFWATQNLVEVGMGVSIISRLATTAGIQPDLTALPIADNNAFRTVCFVTRKVDDRPAVARVKDEIERASHQYLKNI